MPPTTTFPDVFRVTGRVAFLMALAGALRAEEPEATTEALPPGDPAALAVELEAAVAARQTDKAAEIVDGLAATKAPEAFAAIIEHALSGKDYELEKHASAILGETKDPRVRQLVFDGVKKHTNFKTRILLIPVAAGFVDDPSALEAINEAVRDPVRHVAYTAIYWVRKLGKPESVDALIDALEAREIQKVQDRTYFDTRKALEAFFQAQIETAQEWRSLWAARKKGLSSPGRAKESRTVIYKRPKPKFFNMDLDSSRVLFIIDVSGSMLVRDPPFVEKEAVTKRGEDEPKKEGKTVVASREKKKVEERPPSQEELPITRERITRVRAELQKAISLLPATVRFGVLAFSHELEFMGGAKALREATAENKSLAIQWVKSLDAEGATRTDLALDEALSMRDVDTIFVLTDGAPKTIEGSGGTRLPIEPILERVQEQNRFLRARIHTISFIQIRDTQMKRFVLQLAEQNDGTCLLLK